MEDAATAEISRSQVWQWIHHGVELDDGRTVTPELVREIEDEQLERIRAEIGDDEWFEREGRPDASRALFEQVALADDFAEFLTLPAYDYLVETVERVGGAGRDPYAGKWGLPDQSGADQLVVQEQAAGHEEALASPRRSAPRAKLLGATKAP